MNNDEQISKLVDQWIDLLKNRQDDEAQDLYCEHIVPVLIPRLKHRFQSSYNQTGNYDGLISLLGFTPETIAIAYHFTEPQKLVTLYTEETSHLLSKVLQYTGVQPRFFFHEQFSEQPNTDIYRALDSALNRFPKDYRIALELTGGKKTMGGALAVAAGLLNIDVLYIDYDKYMPEFRKPRPESTYIHLVENPLRLSIDTFGSVEINRAVGFFNVGKYDISQELFEEIRQKMVNPRVPEFCASLSQFYSLWNTFNFQEAYNLSKNLFELTLRFPDQILDKFSFDISRLRDQISNTEKLAQGDRIALQWNFFFTAERYKRNGQNDIAALLYYRTLEAVFDNTLKDISEEFDRSKPKYNLICEDQEVLTRNYITFRNNTLGKTSNKQEELPSPIAMVDALCLLGALDHPLLRHIHPARIVNIAKIRNSSVYAHGIQPMSHKSIEDIRKLAVETIQAYTQEKDRDGIEKYRNGFEFMQLHPRKVKT